MNFSAEEVELVQGAQAGSRVILEYTAGDTTLFAASQPGKYVMAVESHRARAIDLQMYIDKTGFPSPAIVWYVDALTGAGSALAFATSVWSEAFFRQPDLVLLRGPMRGVCLVAVLMRSTVSVTVLFDGWMSYPQRDQLERIVTPSRIVGQMAEFVLEPCKKNPVLQELLFELCREIEMIGKNDKTSWDDNAAQVGSASTDPDQQGEKNSPLVGLNSRKSLDLPSLINKSHQAISPKVVLVIASQPRSGSHMLGQALAEDGRFGLPLEYLHPRHWESWEKRCETKTPTKVLEEMIRFRTSGKGIFSIKAHWSQFKRVCDLGLEDFFKEARYIFLTRRDLLGQAISFEIARQTGAWSAEQMVQKTPRFRARRIREVMAEILFQRSSWERYRASTGVRGIDISYEDILEDPKKALKRVANLASLPCEVYSMADQPILPTRVQRGAINEDWRAEFLKTMERASRAKKR